MDERVEEHVLHGVEQGAAEAHVNPLSFCTPFLHQFDQTPFLISVAVTFFVSGSGRDSLP